MYKFKTYIITKHAYSRAKERAGLNKKSLQRIMPRIIEKGLSRNLMSGNLRKWVDSIYYRYGKKRTYRIYHQYLLVFQNNVLITLYRVPADLIKLVEIQMERRESCK